MGLAAYFCAWFSLRLAGLDISRRGARVSCTTLAAALRRAGCAAAQRLGFLMITLAVARCVGPGFALGLR